MMNENNERYQIVLKKQLKLADNEIDLSIVKDRDSAFAKINITVKYQTQRGSLVQQIDLDEDEWNLIKSSIEDYLERAEQAMIKMQDIFQEERKALTSQ